MCPCLSRYQFMLGPLSNKGLFFFSPAYLPSRVILWDNALTPPGNTCALDLSLQHHFNGNGSPVSLGIQDITSKPTSSAGASEPSFMQVEKVINNESFSYQ